MPFRFLLPLLIAVGFTVVAVSPDAVGVGARIDLQPGVALAAEAEEELSATAGALEEELFRLTNNARERYGLPRVQSDNQLLDVARVRAADQAPAARLSHYDAGGQVAFSRLIERIGIPYALAGENLARVPGPQFTAARRAGDALMQSPTHRANILEPSFDRLAVGTVVDAEGHFVFAQIFRAAGAP